MDLIWLLETIGEDRAIVAAGLLVGVVFGIAAQRSRFCLRAAAVEFARGNIGPKTAIWLLTFATALFWTQGAVFLDLLSLDEARMLSATGSISGAILGGLIFGAGMVLARGCSGRLLVLAATGNLRAVTSGLVFAVVAQMSLHGWLSPLRDYLAGLWVTPNGANIQILNYFGLPDGTGALIGAVFAAYALYVAYENKVGKRVLFMSSGVGFAIALGWMVTYAFSGISFDPVQVESATFTGPSADTLMFFLSRDAVIDFDIGLIPGVFLGSLMSAAWSHELQLQGFKSGECMRRYLSGAAMMGFGGMLAGGCAIGAGVTGSSALSLTAWIALTFFWIGAAITDRLVDYRTEVCAVA
ncbi:MAG: YeeE/YedE family protein [Paracoccaceae bacterium]|jgi:uncharacterized membrane protein YedE/YeeE